MDHTFLKAPNRTLLRLSVPVLFSLIAEPVTGIADTAFIAFLGSAPLAALGVGTTVLSSFFWIFNFLAIGTQTQVARSAGQSDARTLSHLASVAVTVALLASIPVAVGGVLFSSNIAGWMAASGNIHRYSVEYMQIRWLGTPAMLFILVGFGTLRGLQDMRTPLKVAVAINALNILLDPLLIFGAGPLPPFGIRGAAAATTLSQWLGAIWLLKHVSASVRLGLRIRGREILPLLKIGRDLFIRTGLLTLFLVLTTRAATRAGAPSGAAHQAIRQVWFFSALFLDSFAITGQSLVAYFLGSSLPAAARQVARTVLLWSLATGVLLGALMWASEEMALALLVPAAAGPVFIPAWRVASFSQPLNAVSFATDGIHWGTGDFAFLRNVVLLVTALGASLLFYLDELRPDALFWIWIITVIWILVRAAFGLLRVWPGIGDAPLGGLSRRR